MTVSRSSWRVERHQHDELTCWHIHSAATELWVAEQGAQVLRYGHQGEPPLIWLSEQAAFKQGQSVRGGVPICWPWFGDLTRNPSAIQNLHAQPSQAPFHGLVRNLPWQLENIQEADTQLTLTFGLIPSKLPDWPHRLVPRLLIRLNPQGTLNLCLTTHNQDQYDLAFTQALHTYLAVSDIRHVSLSGLDHCPYVETLEGWEIRQQQGRVSFSGETDRIYQQVPPTLYLLDPRWKRRIGLMAEGAHSAVVWNPWIEKAQRLSQFAPHAWQGMLCIETANLLDDQVILPPQGQHSLSFSLWAEPLQTP